MTSGGYLMLLDMGVRYSVRAPQDNYRGSKPAHAKGVPGPSGLAETELGRGKVAARHAQRT